MPDPIVLPVQGVHPLIPKSCWLAPNASVIGKVRMGADSTVWFQAVVRGDVAPITIGERVNIQDGAVIHSTTGLSSTTIDDDASIGHNAIVHGAHIERGALVGMGAIVLDNAVIGVGALVAAGAVVTAGTHVPPGTLWAGIPATSRGPLTASQKKMVETTAEHYVAYAKWFG